MGKRIISQARGHGSLTYRVKRSAFNIRLSFLRHLEGKGTVIKLVNSAGHTAPIAKIRTEKGEIFFVPAAKNIVEGQEVFFNNPENVKIGNILKLKDVPLRTEIFCIESRPGDGGKFIKAAGSYAIMNRKQEGKIYVLMPSKKEKEMSGECRAIIGMVAGDGRLDKPFMKAGNKHHLMKSKNKLWPRTSAIKVNVIDHPFGSGRGKNPKSKIAKRDAPPGARVGTIRPRRTGRKKK